MKQKLIKDACPNFWNWLTNAINPKNGNRYKLGYLQKNISRALCIRLPNEGFYIHIFDNVFSIYNIGDFDKKFDRLQGLPGFKLYVRKTCHNDVTAALNLYRRYLVYLNGQSKYLKIDESIENNLDDPKNTVKLKPEQISKFKELAPLPKPKISKIDQKYTYPRVVELVKMALSDSKYQCLINSTHESFINRKTNKKYLEAHHLVPLGAQNDFDYRLDILPNIVCLCPNCHRMLHHGTNIKEILKTLYDCRIDDLRKCGINISFDKLLSYYIG